MSRNRNIKYKELESKSSILRNRKERIDKVKKNIHYEDLRYPLWLRCAFKLKDNNKLEDKE